MFRPFSILYINSRRNVRQHMMKLAGIRRFARSVGWEVFPVPVEESAVDSLRELLKRHGQVGVIVECTEEGEKISPRDLNGVPSVFLSCQPTWQGNKVYKIYNDPTQIVGAAVRELVSNRPCGYVVIGYRKPRDWSRLREDSFIGQVASVGRNIPGDFTLIGVDNLEDICESSSPSISSVQIDFERVGYLSA